MFQCSGGMGVLVWHCRHGWFRQMATPAAGLDIHHILIEGGAHHEDLRAPFAGDKPSVVQARLQEEAIIRRWIQQASAR